MATLIDPFKVAPFSPASLSGLALWLKADSLALNDGDAVATWADQSGQANNATQAVGAARPTYKVNIVNGLPVVRFDGVDDFLALASALSGTAHTVFAVAKSNDTTNGSLVVTTTLDGEGYLGFEASTNPDVAVFVPGAGTSAVSNLTNGDTTWRLLGGKHDGANSIAYADGVAGSSVANTNAWLADRIGLYVPSSYNMDGDVAEIVCYDVALTDADRQSVERYLGTKYGITVP